MNIVFYCQYVWGVGHLFRSLEFARALAGHRVTLVAGGPPVEVPLPGHVSLLRLPALYMDEGFTTLISGCAGKSVDRIRIERRHMLERLFERQRPDVFIVELYPFGRTAFGFELEPLLQAARGGRFGPVRTVCSLRDILVEKKRARAYEQRVLDLLDRYFDLLLVHADERLVSLDETFSRAREIPVPVEYTGFIAGKTTDSAGGKLRKELGLVDGEKLVVASAGGGRSGYRPLKSVLAAYPRLARRRPVRLEVFTGPFMPAGEFEELSSLAGPGARVRRFTQRFLDYLQAADLSVSLAGYNTCMNLLVTRVPALVVPYTRQREQPIRVQRLKPYLPMRVLDSGDLEPERLWRHMDEMLGRPRPPQPVPLNLMGAENAARFLERWLADAPGDDGNGHDRGS